MARLTDHNVVATFPDMDAAREAMLALGRAGVDADRMSMLGRDVREVESDADTRLRDLEVTGDLAKKAAAAGSAGTVLGGIVGAVAFALPGLGPVIGSGIWAAVAGGAVAGGAVGGMVGAVTAAELGPEWEVSYGEPLRQGRVLVAVHAQDDEEASEAAEILEKEGAERVDHIDAEGLSLDES
jgi:outer membrane lipoprotein SlyB